MFISRPPAPPRANALRSLALALPLTLSPALGACAAAKPVAPPTVVTPEAVTPHDPPGAHFKVLMLNGGGNPQLNYQSHLLQVAQLRELLLASGVPADNISILSADGNNPSVDQAARVVQPEADFWMLHGTPISHQLETPTTLLNSDLPGVKVQEATKPSVLAWFDKAVSTLHPGDTLLVYVTDHGTRNGTDPLNNRITLWGNDASIDVHELGELLNRIDPGVRVVTLMSECFSGGFAGLVKLAAGRGEPTGNVCGYFSSTADRPAYGCFTENKGRANVGHSFQFTRALAKTGSFAAAHEETLVTDVSPDTPMRTSDAYLVELLERAAHARGVPLQVVVEERLAQAFKDDKLSGHERELIKHIAEAFGLPAPQTLPDIDSLTGRLSVASERFTTVGNLWTSALGDGAAAHLEHFLARHDDWKARIAEPAVQQLPQPARRALTTELLAELERSASSDEAKEISRLGALHERGETGTAAAYRMQVRLGAAVRMRTLLMTMAGRALLAADGTPAQRAAYDALRSCEDLTLPSAPPALTASSDASAPSEKYPTLDEEDRTRATLEPGWLGINFASPSEERRKKSNLEPGAAIVTVVFPGAPAAEAGLQTGDLVLGPPGHPFLSKGEIRQWTMLSKIGAPEPLEIFRDDHRSQVTITPRPFPSHLPAMPGPPPVGNAAPAVNLTPYRGAVAANLAKGKPHLLYFWATWCGPCKAAIPDLLAFEKERKIPVIAVTDEDGPTLDAFFKKFDKPFPKNVARSEDRSAFTTFAVGGTPTFAYVDEKGVLRSYQVGFVNKGLGVPPAATPAGKATPGKPAPKAAKSR